MDQSVVSLNDRWRGPGTRRGWKQTPQDHSKVRNQDQEQHRRRHYLQSPQQPPAAPLTKLRCKNMSEPSALKDFSANTLRPNSKRSTFCASKTLPKISNMYTIRCGAADHLARKQETSDRHGVSQDGPSLVTYAYQVHFEKLGSNVSWFIEMSPRKRVVTPLKKGRW
jgi:hypothetical protein